MTAALKMAAPGELSSQIKKLMAFCKDNARSIKAMKHHLAVTESVIRDLLNQALAQKLIWRQSNGMYKTCTNKLQFIDDQPAANSLLALAEDADQAQYDADLGNQWDAACTVADGELAAAEANALEQMAAETTAPADAVEIIDLDADLAALEQLGFVHTDGAYYSLGLDDALLSGFNLGKMADEFEREQNNNDYPVIDDLTAKERALSLCSLLLSPSSTELKRCIEAIQMDLAVIRLHQQRRA